MPKAPERESLLCAGYRTAPFLREQLRRCAGQAPLCPAGNALRCSCPSPWPRWHNELQLKAAEPFLSTEQSPGCCIVPVPAGGAGWHHEGAGCPRLPLLRGRPAPAPSGSLARGGAAAGPGWGGVGRTGVRGGSGAPRRLGHASLGPAPRRGGGDGGRRRLPGRRRRLRRRARGCHPSGMHGGGGGGGGWRQGQWAPAARRRGSLPASPRGGGRCWRSVGPAAGAPLPPPPPPGGSGAAAGADAPRHASLLPSRQARGRRGFRKRLPRPAPPRSGGRGRAGSPGGAAVDARCR